MGPQPQPQLDQEMADKYGIPVELLREGMPSFLKTAPDGELILGDYVRVASADGLEAALKAMAAAPSSTTGPSPRLFCYVVAYLPLAESTKIRELVEKQQQEQGAPMILVRNKEVLEAKEGMFDRLQLKIQELESVVECLEDLAPQLHPANPAGAEPPLLALKVQYALAKMNADDLDAAKEMLKGVPGISSNLDNFGLEEMMVLTDHLMKCYPADPQEVLEDIETQLLAALSVADWFDRVNLINDSSMLLEDVQNMTTELQKSLASYQTISTKPSLIGAAPADFEEH